MFVSNIDFCLMFFNFVETYFSLRIKNIPKPIEQNATISTIQSGLSEESEGIVLLSMYAFARGYTSFMINVAILPPTNTSPVLIPDFISLHLLHCMNNIYHICYTLTIVEKRTTNRVWNNLKPI